MKKIHLSLILVGLAFAGYAQNGTATGRAGSTTAKPSTEYEFSVPKDGGDTMVYYTFKPITVYSSLRKFNSPKAQKRYDRLVYHIKKVYPYAHKAGIMLREEESKMTGMDRGDRKAHMKKVEKRLEEQFGDELKALTFTQGRILLKLIDRETGHTSYELVDDLRGSFRAWFYDGIAGLFGYDLKGKYDPHNNLEDRYIEEVVVAIEAGQL